MTPSLAVPPLSAKAPPRQTADTANADTAINPTRARITASRSQGRVGDFARHLGADTLSELGLGGLEIVPILRAPRIFFRILHGQLGDHVCVRSIGAGVAHMTRAALAFAVGMDNAPRAA